MSDGNGSANSGGIGLCGVVFVVFLVLKLVGTIDWSWWYVTMPLWIPMALMLVLAIVMIVFAGLFKIAGSK
jgi:hypothetical protein